MWVKDKYKVVAKSIPALRKSLGRDPTAEELAEQVFIDTDSKVRLWLWFWFSLFCVVVMIMGLWFVFYLFCVVMIMAMVCLFVVCCGHDYGYGLFVRLFCVVVMIMVMICLFVCFLGWRLVWFGTSVVHTSVVQCVRISSFSIGT